MFRRFIISSWAIIWRNSRPLSSLISHAGGIFFAFPTRRHFSNFLELICTVCESEAAKNVGNVFARSMNGEFLQEKHWLKPFRALWKFHFTFEWERFPIRAAMLSERPRLITNPRERVERNGKLQFSTRKLANWQDGISAVKTIENLINWLDLVWVSISNHRSTRFN